MLATQYNDKTLKNMIRVAEVRLCNKLLALDLDNSGISEYNQRYLGTKIDNLSTMIRLYGHLLYLTLRRQPVMLDRFTMVDYGGGGGIISYLAMELGVGTVIYNDIYDVSCNDVKVVSGLLGLPLVHIVCGDIDQVISYVRFNYILVHAVTSYDVLEHIYNVVSHFNLLSSLPNSRFRIVYASGANLKNPRYVHEIRVRQIEAEYKDREKQFGHKNRDLLRSFLNVRKEIITTYAPDLSIGLAEQLAHSTRGLIKEDIEKCVDEYRLKGSIAYVPDHPNNTCDPYTGNWCEHLIEHRWLLRILEDAGFSVEILAGQNHNISGSITIKKVVRHFINTVIWLLGKQAMFIAPYYVVYGDYFPKQALLHPNNNTE